MPGKSHSHYCENEDDSYRIGDTVALNRSVSKESDHVEEPDSSELLSPILVSQKTNPWKHEASVSAPESDRGDATDSIIPHGANINETEPRVEWTTAKQALVDLINETLPRDSVLRTWTIAQLGPIDDPKDLVAILEHPPSNYDLFAELMSTRAKISIDSAADRQRQPDDVAKLERKKRRLKWIPRGMNATVRDSDDDNSDSSCDESLSDSTSGKKSGKDIASIVEGANPSEMTEIISAGSSTAVTTGPTKENAKHLQSVLVGMKELNIDMHIDKSNLVPMNDLDGKKDAEPNVVTPIRQRNLSVRNEFDDTSSEDDDDDDDSSSDISIDVNESDESDDEHYITRGVRPAPYLSARPAFRGNSVLGNHEYKSTNIKTVSNSTWNDSRQTKIYVLPGLTTPPDTVGDVDYLQGAFFHETNNVPNEAYYPYSPASISGDHLELEVCQSASNSGFVQNDVPLLDLQSQLEYLDVFDRVPGRHESERPSNTASFSNSASVWNHDNIVDLMKDCPVGTNDFEHDDTAGQNAFQSIIMGALSRLRSEHQIALLSKHYQFATGEFESNTTICQILAELQKNRGEENAASNSHVAGKPLQQKVRDSTDPPRRPNRNPLTVKQIIEEKLQVSVDQKLVNKMKAVKLLARMAQVFELDDQELMPANNETVLMRLLQDSQNLTNNIELFVVLIERMTRIPSSFNNRDEHNKFALYLAAVNFPTMPEIVGHLAKIMLEGDLQPETISQLHEAIVAVLIEGDSHIAVLRELLDLRRSGNQIFDVNSSVGLEGKTMLQIAYDRPTHAAGPAVETIRELLKRNPRSTIRDYSASLDNGISYQNTNILSDVIGIQTGAIGEYVLRTPEIFGIASNSDKFGQRPNHDAGLIA